MLEYWQELRHRAKYVVLVYGVLFIVAFVYTEQLLSIVTQPLLKNLPKSSHLIATTVTGPIFVKLNLAINCSWLGIIPVIIYQLWHFVTPALQRSEIISACKLVVFSLLLLIIGILLSYFLFVPYLCKFILQSGELSGLRVLPDINYAVDFVVRMLLIFALSFQLPLLIAIAVKFNCLSVPTLIKYRPHFIVASFTIGMLITPPDVFSQIIVALPLLILYELGLVVARFILSPNRH